MSKTAASNPEGILIGKKKQWKIGKMLGQGACGSVHVLDKTPPSSSKKEEKSDCRERYAIKVAPCPAPGPLRTKGGRKKKMTAAQRNAGLIYHENMLYMNVLRDLKGTMVPDVPPYGSGTPSYGEVDGYRFLVMERMAAPLSHVVSSLMDQKGSGPIELGHVAIAMVDCIQAIHNKCHLFVDVKADNFMLAASSDGKSKESASDLAKRIRMIDFGLIEKWIDIMTGGHRENAYPKAPVVGTPLYASLNVLSGHTPSRRDDLEALGYVVAELILMMVHHQNDQSSPSLPWSNGKSDDEIFRVKSAEIDDKDGKSTFFSGIRAGGNDAERVMREYFSIVRKLNYADKPDYDSLKRLLRQLVVVKGGREAESGASKRRRMEMKSQRLAKSSADCDDAKKSSSTPAKKAAIKRQAKDMNSDDENTPPPSVSEPAKKHSKKQNHVTGETMKILITKGPHEGESIFLGEASSTSVTIGRDPGFLAKNKKEKGVAGKIHYKLGSDTETSTAHAKLVLHTSKGRALRSSSKDDALCSVRVTDLKSTNGTYINGKQVPKGGSRQAFTGDKIQMGASVFELKQGN